jgi:hypothetical protein
MAHAWLNITYMDERTSQAELEARRTRQNTQQQQ